MAKKSNWKNKIKGYELVDPQTLLANPHNFRIHNEIQTQHLETLLDTIGWVDVVKVNQTGKRIIDGHLRHSMAIQAGEKLIPVLWVKLTKKQEKLALASLDWISSLAEIDTTILSDLLVDIDDFEILPDDSNLLEMIAKDGGFDIEDDQLEDPGPDIDKADELRKKWGVKTGQMWQLGEHRIICGDCTDETVVERLMGGELGIKLLVADPPYGIDLDTDYSKLPSTKLEGNKSYTQIVGDESPFAYGLLTPLNCKEEFWFGADYYAKTLPDGGSWLVWDKRV